MSKASAFARRMRREMRFTERLTRFERRRRMIPLRVYVGPHGHLHFGEDNRVRPVEALRFARWILATFSDSPDEATGRR